MSHDIAIPIARQTAGATPHPLAPAAGEAARTAVGVRSLYLHIPFCFHKCHYCDFYSIVDRRDRQEAFTRRLMEELGALAPFAAPLETVFVGGGTPTLLRADLWRELLAFLRRRFDLASGGPPEFTVECNPETASPELFDALVAGGVNRLSIGAQSFDPRHLSTLERWHDRASVGRALAHARRAGIERLSLDLIYAIPGQTLADWRQDLERALELGPGHLSCYALTYEPNTAMTRRLERGDFAPAHDDLEVAMYEHTLARLREAGLERYEVSNFARPGHACRHNLAYWRAEPWLAAGPSASGHVAGHRWKVVPHLGEYLASSGLPPVVDHEPPDPRRALSERLMTGVRIASGVPVAETLARAREIAPEVELRLAAAATRAAAEGLLEACADRWRPTGRGFLFADGLAWRLMEAVEGEGAA